MSGAKEGEYGYDFVNTYLTAKQSQRWFTIMTSSPSFKKRRVRLEKIQPKRREIKVVPRPSVSSGLLFG